MSYLGTGTMKDSTEKAREWEEKTLALNDDARVEALWAADEGASEFIEAKDAMRVFRYSDADTFADRADFADGRA